MRATKVVTVSLPPGLLKDMERLTKEEGRTRSELFREALREYIATRRWHRIRRWGEAAARRTAVKDEADVERIVQQYRRAAKYMK